MATRSLNAVSAQEALVESLRGRILAGEFTPGSAVSDVKLAAEYGVARPTVRAAVQVLVHEGLMRREPRRQAFVPRLASEDIRDLYLVRIPLELWAVEALVGDSRALRPAVVAVERFEQLDPQASWRDAVEADARFHAALVAGVGSPRLERTYGSLQAEIRLALLQLEPVYESVAALALEHRRVVDVIAAGPKRDAVRVMREHLEQAVEDLTAA